MNPNDSKTVLIVDDDRSAVMLERQQLVRAGFDVLLAATADAARQILKRQTVALIVLNHESPGVNGREFCSGLRAAGIEIPVITVTAAGSEDTRIQTLRTNLRHHIIQSVDSLDALAPAVQRILQQVNTEWLAESEALLGAIVRSALDAIITVDDDGRITLFNRAAARMFQCNETDAIGQPLSRFVPCAVTGLSQPSKAGESPIAGDAIELAVGELDAIRTTGEVFPVEVSVSQAEMPGRAFHTVIVRDLSESKKTARRLTDREARLRTILDSEPESVTCLDYGGALLEINPAGLAMIEADAPQQVIGHCVYSLITPEHRQAFQSLTERVFRGESGTLEFEIQGLKGGRRWLESHAAPLRDESGQVCALLAVSRDVTESRRAAESLRESEQRYRNLVELAPDAILLLEDGCIQSCNRAGLNLLGAASLEELRGRLISPFFHAADREVAEARERSIRENGCPVPPRCFRIVRLDNQVVHVESYGAPCRHQGRPATQLLFRDLTERLRAEEELRSTQVIHAAAQAQAHIGSWQLDLATQFNWWSAEMYRLFGRNPTLGVPTLPEFFELVHPDDRVQVDAAWRRVLETGTAGDLELRTNPDRGPIRHLSLVFHLVRDVGGEPRQLAGISQDVTRQKQAEAALTASDSLCSSLVETLPINVFRKDLEGRFVFANRSFCELLGRSLDEIRGRTDADYYPPHLAAAYRADDQHVIATDAALEKEEAHATPDGKARNVQMVKTPVRDANGQVIGVQGVFWDITERRQAEAERARAENALRLSLERFSLVARATNDALWDWDVVADRVWWNDQLFEMAGMDSRTTPSFDAWAARIHPDDAAGILTGFNQSLERRDESWAAEYRFLHPDGSVRHVLDRALLLYDVQGRPIRAVGGISDITASKRAADELRAQDVRLRLALQQAQLVLWSTNADLKITSSLGAGLKALNLEPDQLNGKMLADCVAASEESDETLAKHRRALAGESLRYEQTWLTRVFDVHLEPLRTESGEIIGCVAVGLDITERKQADDARRRLESQIQHAQKLESLGILAGGIAHDFNNLLTSMLGYASLALMELPNDSVATPFLREIEQAAARGRTHATNARLFGTRQVRHSGTSGRPARARDGTTAGHRGFQERQAEADTRTRHHRGRRHPDSTSCHELDHERVRCARRWRGHDRCPHRNRASGRHVARIVPPARRTASRCLRQDRSRGHRLRHE